MSLIGCVVKIEKNDRLNISANRIVYSSLSVQNMNATAIVSVLLIHTERPDPKNMAVKLIVFQT